MRCREAERRLNLLEMEGAEFDEHLRQHLACCPSCARRHQAAIALRRALDAGRAAAQEPVRDLAALRRSVESSLPPHRTHRGKVQLIMAKIWNPLSGRVRWGIGIGAAAIAAALITLVPFKYEKTVGYEVAFAGVDPALAMDQSRIHTMLTKLGVQRADIDIGECEETCKLRIAELETPEDCQLIVCAFEEMGNVVVLNDGSANQIHEVRETSEPAKFVSRDGKVSCYFSRDEAHQIVIERLGEDFAREYNIFVSKECTVGLDGSENIRIDMIAAGAGAAGEGGQACRVVCPTPGGGQCEAVVKCIGDSVACGIGSCEIRNSASCCSLDGGLSAILAKEGLTLEDLRNGPDEAILEKLARLGITVVSEGDRHFVYRDGGDNTSFGSVNEWEGDPATDEAAKSSVTPEGYELGQNYPNPFNPSTSIDYLLPASQHVRIEIINVMGRTVRTLVDEVKGAGNHTVLWDGEDRNGRAVPSGTYFYRIETPGFRQTRSMALLK